MSSLSWSAFALRWPPVLGRRRGGRFWGLASGAALAASVALMAVLDGLWSRAAVPLPTTGGSVRVPGFAITRGAGYLSHGEMFALHLVPDGARLVPACPAGHCLPIHLRLIGGRTGLRLRPEDPLPATAPGTADGWLGSPARLFASVLYEDVYPGIALRFRGQSDDFSYAFLVDRGASPQSIVLELDGVERIVETPGGGLVATSAAGTSLVLAPPSAQQDAPVDAWYVVRSRRRVTLDVGLYDVRRPLAVWGGRADLTCPHRSQKLAQ